MKKMTIDGNTAASHVAYAFSEVAAIYPITPSSPMAESADEWASKGQLNMFGQPLRIAELQSEGGAAGAVHGSLTAGALTTTYTASQGLLLMIPNMYKIAGEMLPTVFHVSARALAASALNIFGDHSDVMACRQTGFAMMCSGSVQEVMDLALVSHLATLKSKIPFLHYFDGFRTSHEVSKIDVIEYDEMKSLVNMDEIRDFKNRALNPEHPVQKGTAQNPDIYFQGREAVNKYYDAVPEIVKEKMEAVSKLTGRKYELYQYYGAPDADRVIVLMGSGAESVEETVKYLTAKGEKVGMIKVRLYRPFSMKDFVGAIPASCKKLAVLDRTKEPGSLGEPLYLDVCAALTEMGKTDIKVVGGRYGLGSKEFTPSMINAIYNELAKDEPKNHFTIGINDDVTGTSIPYPEFINAAPKSTVRCKFYGFGGDGTVGANKNSIKIIGDHTDKYAQGYFEYDSKKSGGFTLSHLRFGDEPIQSEYLIDEADFVACHKPAYVTMYDMISSLKDGGTFLLNCKWTDEELDAELPASMKQLIAKKNVKMYAIDALATAKKAGIPRSQNMVLQAAFFNIANIIPYAEAEGYMKKAVEKTYGKKGPEVVKANCDAIDMAISELRQVAIPASWANANDGAVAAMSAEAANDKYYTDFVAVINAQEGNKLPVSMVSADGTVPTGTTKYEKRGTAAVVPMWDIDNCIQCNQCSYVCPHAVIRPVLLTEDEVKAAPEGFKTKAATGFAGMQYRIQISPLDCTGCSSCANVCPAKNKALKMVDVEEAIKAEKDNWDYAITVPVKEVAPTNPKNSQFSQPLFEFSGACAGCGETPYVKLVTQLYGDRMIIANATGCSSIYGGSAPVCPYTKNAKGEGPAWGNSLFEDNAEFGYGMFLAYKARREKLAADMQKAIDLGVCECLKAPFEEWGANMKSVPITKKCAAEIKANLPEAIKKADGELKAVLETIYADSDCIVKKSFWIIGGDGWAYDIGYGGLDHVLAQDEDVNVLVLDTEVYSNTGGQSSKATPTGSVAKFAASGKRTKKKDLGMMAMSYGYVYVAQCAMGASQPQLLKAITEAEAYDGPSLVICYATCINHGIRMDLGQQEQKKAVESGYWQLYRYNPDAGFTLDSKDPTASYQEFLMGETRYKTLKAAKPDVAEKLFAKAEEDAKARLDAYKIKAGK
ncbi:MAG: pyruvate:ferredoxin (flavodoxin) oxidoreductase [Clostridia bacterium]|nr:pyruvate:ferredoxin (flavodoxin) oxidoreductase [Clostridia bacterium]